MHGFDPSLIGLVHEVYQLDRVVLHGHADEWRAARHQLHVDWQRGAAHFDSLDDLVQLEVSDDKVIALSDETQMQSQVIVGEDSFTFMHWVNFVVN